MKMYSEEEIRKALRKSVSSLFSEPFASHVYGCLAEKMTENLTGGVTERRKVTCDADCADCLCRVCARNRYNDSYNKKAFEDEDWCEGCNGCNGYIVDLDEDCPRNQFLPDEDDEGDTDEVHDSEQD